MSRSVSPSARRRSEVGHRSWFAVPDTEQDDAVQRRVRVPVATAGQAVACALSRRSRNWGGADQGSEGRLRREPRGVIALSHHQRRSGERPDSVERQKPRVERSDETFELLVDRGDLVVEHGIATRKSLQGLAGNQGRVGRFARPRSAGEPRPRGAWLPSATGRRCGRPRAR